MPSVFLDHLTQKFLPAIEDELHIAFERLNDHGINKLYHMLAYHMGWVGDGAGPDARGKRIRPLLVLLTCAAGGGNWQNALPAAAAVELVHNFSLIHDDIEDHSPLRRGRPTVWEKWGIPQAINTGDAMFTLAHLESLRLAETVSPEVALQAAKIMQQTCLHLTQGQFLDLYFETKHDVTIYDYWLMVEGKTAALLSSCTELGALAASCDDITRQYYRNFGRVIGLAFQVQDDWLGIWGDSALTGKSSDSDLVTGKKTLPVLYGLSQHKAFAARWIKGPILPDQTKEMAMLLESEGVKHYMQSQTDMLINTALESLEAAKPDVNAGDALKTLAIGLIGREV